MASSLYDLGPFLWSWQFWAARMQLPALACREALAGAKVSSPCSISHRRPSPLGPPHYRRASSLLGNTDAPFCDLVIPVTVIITVLAAGSALSLQGKVHHSSSLLFLRPGELSAGPQSSGTGPGVSVLTAQCCNTPSCWGTAGDQDHLSALVTGFISRQTASSSLPFL